MRRAQNILKALVMLALWLPGYAWGQGDNVMRGKFYALVDSSVSNIIRRDLRAAAVLNAQARVCVQEQREYFLWRCLEMCVDATSGVRSECNAVIDSAMALFGRRSDDEGIRSLYIANLSRGFCLAADADSASISAFGRAAELSSKLGMSKVTVFCWCEQAEAMCRTCHYNGAAVVARKALAEARKLGEPVLRFLAQNALVRVYSLLRANQMADGYIDDIEREAVYVGKPNLEMHYLLSKANLSIQAGRLSVAAPLCQRADTIAAQIGNPLWQWRARVLTARLMYAADDLEGLRKAIGAAQLFQENGDMYKRSERYSTFYLPLFMAHIKCREQKFEEAFSVLRSAGIPNHITTMLDLADVYYRVYGECLSGVGNYRAACRLLNEYERHRDSLTTSHNIVRQEDMEAIFRGDTTILRQRATLVNQSQSVGHMKMRFVMGFMLTLLAVLVIVVILVAGKRKERQREELRNIDRRERLRADVESQTAELQRQNNLINERNTDIMLSEQYARRIQQSVMPSIDDLNGPNWFSQSAVIYRPIGATGGDFHWHAEAGEFIMLALGDCSGHGIPGAMMSMVGVTLVNDVLRRYGRQESAAQLLERIHQNMADVMPKLEAGDWINITILLYNRTSRMANIAAAYQKIIILTDGRVEVVRGTKRHLGDRNETFSDRRFTDGYYRLAPGDNIYLFTDGVTNMMERETGVKLKLIGLESFVEGSLAEPPAKRQDYVRNQLNHFKELAEQTDDITFIALTI